MYIKLKSKEGKVIETKVGSCWTCVFLSFLGPLLRGDVKFFILYALLDGIGLFIALYFNENIGVPLMVFVTLLFEANYNTWFIRGKLNNGWEAETEKDREILIEKGVIKVEV
ncbi:hypothetical protein IA817_11300 [Listeria seeligeri]|uniref:hypothetical protein n=2 Tax=Listeria seeligeri TaxID=1640 RepID=UPI0001C4E411|nr:hypothetical protein [Listeria seeligeri]MBC1586145.1 hypothetical protein [Listeria seeligeri]MBC2071365.1 hypothetical protein [Listeria seeligeri]MBC2087286.1 hypothetical protein [Listeria seeligeri]MBC2246856.1 hypothetical protein [Listeria seeligeri]MBF2347483.1 hypothetical protein [Listeria seeligeri]